MSTGCSIDLPLCHHKNSPSTHLVSLRNPVIRLGQNNDPPLRVSRKWINTKWFKGMVLMQFKSSSICVLVVAHWEHYWLNAFLMIGVRRYRGCFEIQVCPGPRPNIKTILYRYVDSNVKDKRSRDRLIFNMGIPILVRRHLYIETAPCSISDCIALMPKVLQ